MSAFTFFKALDKISEIESNKKKGRIKIPDYFIKLILMNKTKLLREQLNKKILKELFINRHLISKNFNQPKIPNFFLANQKYKSLQKISRNIENTKSSSPLPKIDQRRSVLNLRYKDNMKINNNEKSSNKSNEREKDKETINIKTRRSKLLNKNNYSINNPSINHSININKNSIKTELVIPNKSVRELYCINKKVINNNNKNDNNNNINNNNKNDNKNENNNNNNPTGRNNNSENKTIKKNTFHEQIKNKGKGIIPTELNFENPNSNNLRMTFITPLSRSICFNPLEKNSGNDIIMNELCKNNSSKKFNPKFDNNNISSKN